MDHTVQIRFCISWDFSNSLSHQAIDFTIFGDYIIILGTHYQMIPPISGEEGLEIATIGNMHSNAHKSLMMSF